MKASGCFLILVCMMPLVDAGIRPSFWLSRCAWDAVDVLELAISPDGGRFSVVASLKGAPESGSFKTFPELMPPADDHRLLRDLVLSFPSSFRDRRAYEIAPPIREVDRLILFLRSRDEPSNETLLTSAIWLQDGFAYAFEQTNNPGPTHLVPLLTGTKQLENGQLVSKLSWKKETQVRSEIHRLLQLRETFDHAVANSNALDRVAELVQLLMSGDGVVIRSALARLSREGSEAGHALRPLLDDENLLNVHFEILDTIAATGTRDISLDPIVRREADYWTNMCRQELEPNWVRTYGKPPAIHYLTLVSALEAIRALGLNGDLPAVRKFGNVMSRCQPLLEQKELAELKSSLLSQ